MDTEATIRGGPKNASALPLIGSARFEFNIVVATAFFGIVTAALGTVVTPVGRGTDEIVFAGARVVDVFGTKLRVVAGITPITVGRPTV